MTTTSKTSPLVAAAAAMAGISADGNVTEAALAQALISRIREMRSTLRDCHQYFDGIPETAAGGDDRCVLLARNCKHALRGIDL